MNTNTKKELFESVPVPKAIAAMAIPTIISQLINLVYSMADAFFIGRTGDSFKTGAITVAFTLYMMTIAFSNLCGIGGGSLITRLISTNDTENAKKVSSYSVYLSVIIALVYSLIVAVFMDPILKLFGASENTILFARQYTIFVVVIGNVPVILSLTLAHLLRNVGYSKQASIGLSGGSVLNIILDPILMFVILPEGMEVVGAAAATLIANVASCIYLLLAVRKVSKKAALSLSPKDIKGIRKTDLKELYAVGIPSAILTGLFDVANIFLNSLMAAHSDFELAAIGIVMKAERLPNAINLGICQGMLPIVAYNYASGNAKRMHEIMKTVRIYGLIIAVLSMILFQIFVTPIVKIFLSTSTGNIEDSLATIGFATLFLRIRCLGSLSQFMNYHSSYCLQAMGDGKDTLIHALVRELGFYIPSMYLLDMLFGSTGLAWALILGETLGGIFALWLLSRYLKKHRRNTQTA